MKIVFASTQEQEEEIVSLIFKLHSAILPTYISEQELKTYKEMGLLKFTKHGNLYNGTLKQAYHVMVALQTIIYVIEHVNECDETEYNKMEQLFDKNTSVLHYYGLFFPISLDSFKRDTNDKEHLFFISQPMNELII